MIDGEAVPLLRRCSLAGHADYKTRAAVFQAHPLAVDMLIDILTGRLHNGFVIVILINSDF